MNIVREPVNPVTADGAEWVTEAFHAIDEAERRQELLKRIAQLDGGYDEHALIFGRVILFGWYDEQGLDRFIDGEELVEAEVEIAEEHRIKSSVFDAVDVQKNEYI